MSLGVGTAGAARPFRESLGTTRRTPSPTGPTNDIHTAVSAMTTTSSDLVRKETIQAFLSDEVSLLPFDKKTLMLI